MSTGDLPAITSSAYSSHAVGIGTGMYAASAGQMPTSTNTVALAREIVRRPSVQPPPVKETVMATRLIQVFVADPNDNLPLSQRLLYSGEQKITDLTDEELFYDIEIKGLLEKHNEIRAKTPNKKIKERTEYLEPARIRDLKMVVVTIATF